MKYFKTIITALLLGSITAFAAGKLQNSDFATSASITGAGGTIAQLLNTSKIYDSTNAQLLDTTIAAKLNTSAFTDSAVTSKLITGFSSGAGAVAGTDTILQAINKLDGNTAAKMTNPMTTAEDLIKGGASGTPTRLAVGSNGQCLTVSGGSVGWGTCGTSSPLTTKGDLYTYDTGNARLPVGTNGQVLSANSAQATGLEWITPASGGDASTNTATSVDSEVALFSGTGGKTLKRATGTGYAKLASGVLSAQSTPIPSADVNGGRTINAQTGTSYTFALSDGSGAGGFPLVTASNAAAQTYTVPPNSSVAFPVGTQIDLVQQGAGAVTIAPGSGVTINAANGVTTLANQYTAASLVKTATDTWSLVVSQSIAGGSAYTWNGYFDSTCVWSRSNSSFGDPASDASCALVERLNNNFGSVTATSGLLPKINFTAPKTGTINVCAVGNMQATAANYLYARIYDGTNSLNDAQLYQTNTQVNPMTICGQMNVTVGQSVNLAWQWGSSGGTAAILNQAGSGSEGTLNWTLSYVNGGGSGSVGSWTTETGNTPSAGAGTVTGNTAKCRRNGENLECEGYFVTGTVAASTMSIALPTTGVFACTIDFTKLPTATGGRKVGEYTGLFSSYTINSDAGGSVGHLFTDGSTATTLYFAYQISGAAYAQVNGSGIMGNSEKITYSYSVPCTGF